MTSQSAGWWLASASSLSRVPVGPLRATEASQLRSNPTQHATTVRCRQPTGKCAHFSQVPEQVVASKVAAILASKILPPLRSLMLLHTPGCFSPGLVARGLASLALQGCERVDLAVLDRGDIVAQPGDTLVGESKSILLQVLGLGKGCQGHGHYRTQRATLFYKPTNKGLRFPPTPGRTDGANAPKEGSAQFAQWRFLEQGLRGSAFCSITDHY